MSQIHGRERPLILHLQAPQPERVGDHAKNIAEHVIYMVKGTDVRHLGLSGLEEQVKSE